MEILNSKEIESATGTGHVVTLIVNGSVVEASIYDWYKIDRATDSAFMSNTEIETIREMDVNG